MIFVGQVSGSALRGRRWATRWQRGPFRIERKEQLDASRARYTLSTARHQSVQTLMLQHSRAKWPRRLLPFLLCAAALSFASDRLPVAHAEELMPRDSDSPRGITDR